jgi:shikimate dehydrogenase
MTESALQEIAALLGCPAAGHPAQFLFERGLTAAGLDWRFLTCDVAEKTLLDSLRGAAALGFRGCLIAGPLRTRAFPFVDEASPSASFAEAVSTVEFADGRIVGDMTEGRGALEAIRSHIDPAGEGVLILGTGPSSRAVALELALARAGLVVIADRDREQASTLAEAVARLDAEPTAVAVAPWTQRLRIPEAVKIVVAAVPMDESQAVLLDGWRADLVVVDLAVVSQPSPLMAFARHAGCCTIDGLDVHCEQAAIDFRNWTGKDADPDMLREALDEFFSA